MMRAWYGRPMHFMVTLLCLWCHLYIKDVASFSIITTLSRKVVSQGLGFTSSTSSSTSAAPASLVLSLSQDESHDEVTDDTSSSHFSKTKWKKKRFLMMKDVTDRVRRGDPHAPRKAEEMIRRMQNLYEATQEPDYKPNLQAYNLWINALAKSDLPDAGEKAEEILHSLLLLSRDDPSLMPSVVTYTCVMDAYAHQSKAQDAERILLDLLAESERRRSLQVTSITCDTVLNAWAQEKTWDAAERAEEILQRLEILTQDQSTLSIRPTAHSYATVIHSWASCGGGREAAERANAILDRMLSQAERSKKAVEPDTVVFNAVMNAWATSGDAQAGTRALALLKQMQEVHASKGYDCRPDTVSYNTVLSAWSHSGHINAATQAERVLQEMTTAHKANPESAPAPNTVSYNSVLHAWSKSHIEGGASRAEKILDYMIRAGSDDFSPDVYSFTSVLDALAKSKESDKAMRASELLGRLLELGKRPKSGLRITQVPFNTVLNACAFSATGTSDEERRQALQIAVQTFKLMRQEQVQPDVVSYGNMIKCVTNLLPSGQLRTDMALQLFEKCCEDGLVGDLAWQEVCRAVPTNVLGKRLDLQTKKPISYLQLRDLPRSWRQNANEKAPRTARKGKVHERNDQRRKDNSGTQSQPIRRLRNISEPSYQSGRDL